MTYTLLPGTELQLSKVCFGAWAIGGWMWGGADKADALTAIARALDFGITSFDTAPVYGFGHSESVVGEALSQTTRDKVQILTKYGLRWDTGKGKFYFVSRDNSGQSKLIHKYAGADSIIEECENSLRRLRTDYIDLYQIHWPDSTTPIDETMKAAEKLIAAGKIRYAGVCNYSALQLSTALQSLSVVTNQVPYSMLTRDIEQEVVPLCMQRGVGILAYSPLQRGVLTGKFQPGQAFNNGDHRAAQPHYKPENIARINTFLSSIKPIAETHKASISQLVLNWTLCQPGISAVLAGARNPTQVADNAGAVNFQLSADELRAIDNELNKLLPTIQ